VGLHQIKNFFTSKETITRMKRQLTEWVKIFVNYSLDKGLISRIYKHLKNLGTKRSNNPITNSTNKLNIVLKKRCRNGR
jgi:hypothetical protein